MPATPPPAISVVMPVYNGERFLRRSIASLAAQKMTDWELVAVDDNSADGSLALLEELAAADPRIRVFSHPVNRRQAAARNTALQHTLAPLIAYLDQDDEFYPDHFARVREWSDRAGVLVFRYDLLDEIPDSRTHGQVTTHDPASQRQFALTHTISVPLGVVHCRDLLDRVGLFDEQLGNFRGLDEDGDLWRRFAKAGEPFVFIPHASGLYHIHADSCARTRPDPPPTTDGPSHVVTVEVCAETSRYAIRVPQKMAGNVTRLFERHEYGGLPRRGLTEKPVIVDVGAGVGAFTLYAKLAINRLAVVHCFEPCPAMASLLRQNLTPFSDTGIHPVGLGLEDGAAILPPRPERDDHPMNIAIRHAGTVWDEFGLRDVDILRLNAGGAEPDILAALGPRLSQMRVVLIDFHTSADRRRIDALLPGHELFGMSLRTHKRGIAKYIRADLTDFLSLPADHR
ncbi:FkbM family methyltransferase [Zavarzinella formosa]|uniref:FkbM family methyltransferase n=1 Tax=Zavarzinella formosa TaxID=360055 RepID=UPI0002E3F951|nr:FkbM family methyltransferase [Zavarzinella formosa]